MLPQISVFGVCGCLCRYTCWGNWTGQCNKGGKSLACNPKWVVDDVIYAGPCCARR
jgi:hypothetical protein